jgi:uncharacterized protein
MNKATGLMIAMLLVLTGCAASSARLPALTGRVVDEADLLDVESEDVLNVKLESVERHFGPQLVVVTVKSLGGKSIADFSLTLGNKWGIGNKDRDDGMILLVAPNERRVRIEVGYGLESSFPNRICQAIIDETIVPNFVAGRMQNGIVDAVDRILARMKVMKPLPSNENDALNEQEDTA